MLTTHFISLCVIIWQAAIHTYGELTDSFF